MSTNIHFLATRDIIVVKTGKQDKQEIYFDRVWQTPTRVTLEIIKNDPIQGYRDYILNECSEDREYEIYAEDDIFCETPIGTETYNPGREHLEEFDAWVRECEESGYTIQAEAW